ncbi:hypothetical protein F3Y22_tig00110482pilonHSYRG00835 [Hibiscus syriacus]|uniref:Uncharacterized protein n=1 Tax=Hibiscus syriacus TaxID=106335 RepID=A0A6A3AFD1_HIBSY|nr:hypothetical protein F3Y22_tig00110482pilonHSYRG00835 [Hibiscus syriacus]
MAFNMLRSIAVGGLLNATFGNATELIISICALKSGMTVLFSCHSWAQFCQTCFVLGCAFFCGGLVYHRKEQVFNKLRSRNDFYPPIDEEGSRDGEGSDNEDDEAPQITKWESVIWLTVLTAGSPFYQAILWIHTCNDGASEAWDLSIAFISVILLPITGNAAEHASAIMFVMKTSCPYI